MEKEGKKKKKKKKKNATDTIDRCLRPCLTSIADNTKTGAKFPSNVTFFDL